MSQSTIEPDWTRAVEAKVVLALYRSPKVSQTSVPKLEKQPIFPGCVNPTLSETSRLSFVWRERKSAGWGAELLTGCVMSFQPSCKALSSGPVS